MDLQAAIVTTAIGAGLGFVGGLLIWRFNRRDAIADRVRSERLRELDDTEEALGQLVWQVYFAATKNTSQAKVIQDHMTKRPYPKADERLLGPDLAHFYTEKAAIEGLVGANPTVIELRRELLLGVIARRLRKQRALVEDGKEPV